jgi:hypothetical protein
LIETDCAKMCRMLKFHCRKYMDTSLEMGQMKIT